MQIRIITVLFIEHMKLSHIIIAILMVTTSFINADGIVLPKPQTTGGKPLNEMMRERKSSRDITPNKGITQQDLSNMLWAAWGITHDDKRTIATAMNRQELVIYVVTDKEALRYNPEANTLTLVNTGDFRQYAALQDFAVTAPVNIVLAVDTNKQDKIEFQAYTAGAASQNIYLYCAQAGLKTVLRAGFDREKLPQVLKLPENEKILFVQSVGL